MAEASPASVTGRGFCAHRPLLSIRKGIKATFGFGKGVFCGLWAENNQLLADGNPACSWFYVVHHHEVRGLEYGEDPIDLQCSYCECDLRTAIDRLETEVNRRLKSAKSVEWYVLARLAESLAEVSRRATSLDYVGLSDALLLPEGKATKTPEDVDA
jgi:hypothetical protein